MFLIENRKLLEEFERSLIAGKKANFKQNMAIYEAMYKYARKMMKGRKIDPLEGIDVDIRIAKVINSV